MQQIVKRNNESSTASNIVNKCLSPTTKHDNDDIEYVLLNECIHDQPVDELDEITIEPNNDNGSCDKEPGNCSDRTHP